MHHLVARNSHRKVIMLEEISSSKAETESDVGAAVTNVAMSSYLFDAPEEKIVAERGKESSMGIQKQTVDEDDRCDTDM